MTVGVRQGRGRWFFLQHPQVRYAARRMIDRRLSMVTSTAPTVRKKAARTGRTTTRRAQEPSEAKLQAYLADIDRRMAENERRLDELLIRLQTKPAT
jgi:CRP-like cAMP-binding protein